MKICYLSCHSVLESVEVKMFHDLGYEIFSPGAYINPSTCSDGMRVGIEGLEYDPKWVEIYNKICQEYPGIDGRLHLTKELIDEFDTIIVMHVPEWIKANWNMMKHKRVIWRTIGQSISSTEVGLAPYRAEGLQIVRYSGREARIPGFIGQDALIRFGIDPKDFNGWTGQQKSVVTFNQSMEQRGESCNYTVWEQVTRPFPRKLYGPENNQPGFGMGKVSFGELQQALRDNRVYVYTGTQPASYTLNFIEALMSGIPLVALGPLYGNAAHLRNHDLYEIPDLIENEVNGFYSDDLRTLEAYIRNLLENDNLARQISNQGRKSAIKHFNIDMISLAWKAFLG